MLSYARHLPVLAIYALVMVLHIWAWRRLLGIVRVRWMLHGVFALLVALMSVGLLLGFTRVTLLVPEGAWRAWVRAASMSWALFSVGACLLLWVWRRTPEFNPARRQALRAAGIAAAAAPVLAAGYGTFIERSAVRERTLDLPVAGLPPDLDGLRVAQLTDIHLGPFLSGEELARAVDIANEFRPHLALVTGDLVTERGDPLDACLKILSRLRASDGNYGCLGNHEGYARAEAYTATHGARLGIDFLRSERRSLTFGSARLNLAGVDYQRMGGPYLAGARALILPGAFNVLLSHNPDVFPVAAEQGFRLVFAGHTHGGQINFEVLGFPFNVAELYTPFVYGVYRRGGCTLHVSRGIGTVGLPVRIGAPPEVNLVRLIRVPHTS